MGQADGVRDVRRAPAKLTLSLRVTGVRDDGYHLIDAEMVSLSLADTLTFTDGSGVSVVGADVEDTLVGRALAAIGRTARVVIDKHIPAGAGLGGGSSDAACVLRWAGCDDLSVAVSLGADVPFCLVGGRARVSGIGEVVTPLPFVDQALTLLTPPFGVSSAAVYAEWDRLGGPTGPNGNDLEPAALSVEPRLAEFRDRLGEATGLVPRLAGSGSTWFVEGAFPGEDRVVTRTDRP
jgi:4-diphosphocytidyl-2-C-methyl-D-erythritol kinase